MSAKLRGCEKGTPLCTGRRLHLGLHHLGKEHFCTVPVQPLTVKGKLACLTICHVPLGLFKCLLSSKLKKMGFLRYSFSMTCFYL